MRVRSAVLPLIAGLMFALTASAHNHSADKTPHYVPVTDPMPGHEIDMYRYGQMIAAMRGTSPESCEQACSQDARCASWSLVPASFQIGPVCELKATLGQQAYRPGTISGLAIRLQMGPSQIQPVRQTARPVAQPRQVAQPRPVEDPPIRLARPDAPAVDMLAGGLAPGMTRQPQPAPQQVVPVQPRYVPESPKGPQETRSVPQFQMMAPAPQGRLPEGQAVPVQPMGQMVPAQQSRQAAPAQGRPQMAPPPQNWQSAPAQGRPQMAPPPQNWQSAPAQSRSQMAPPPQSQPVRPNYLPAPRQPWTERVSGQSGYSVNEGMDYVPGDEEATAGYGTQLAGGR